MSCRNAHTITRDAARALTIFAGSAAPAAETARAENMPARRTLAIRDDDIKADGALWEARQSLALATRHDVAPTPVSIHTHTHSQTPGADESQDFRTSDDVIVDLKSLGTQPLPGMFNRISLANMLPISIHLYMQNGRCA
jgi:hypothetical protein